METIIESKQPVSRVFISYSTPDRPRVDGLERLLKLFGHEVFMDFKQIRLGSRWKDEIACALDQTDVTLVYWTRSAASSMWVKAEYECFLASHPTRPLVPIIGDETPLPDPLKERQALNLIPAINELLELKRCMESEGRKKGEIQAAIRQRLEQAGIRMDKTDERKIFRFLGVAGWMAWLPAPLVLFKWLWHLFFQATTQLSPAQVVVMLAAAAAAAALAHQGSSRTTAAVVRQAARREAERDDQLRREQEKSRQSAAVAAAREAELNNAVRGNLDTIAGLKGQAKEREEGFTKQMKQFYRKADTHAIVEVPGFEKPVLLRFVDKTTGQHRFTVQVPRQQDFSFWIPAGPYSIYLAHTDLSDKLPQLVSGNVELELLDEVLPKQRICTLQMVRTDKTRKRPTPADFDFGSAKPSK